METHLGCRPKGITVVLKTRLESRGSGGLSDVFSQQSQYRVDGLGVCVPAREKKCELFRHLGHEPEVGSAIEGCGDVGQLHFIDLLCQIRFAQIDEMWGRDHEQ